MRALALALCLLTAPLAAQTTGSARPATAALAQMALRNALLGTWAGVLEYRDFSDPATSTRRIQLPTWLTIENTGDDLTLTYTYDDGPGKTVGERETLTLNLTADTYTVNSADRSEAKRQTYTIAGADELKDGRGTLTLTGSGTDNGNPAEIRTAWVIRRNLISWLEEVRPANSSGSFAFRHRYTFTRAEAPALSTK